MSVAKDFKELIIWQRAHVLALEVYRVTDRFPNTEQFGLTNQLRRAAVSVPSNIAEGFERGTRAEFITFLGYSKGSCGELRSQLYRAFDRNYISEKEFEDLKIFVLQISGLIQNFISYLQKSEVAGVRKKVAIKKP